MNEYVPIITALFGGGALVTLVGLFVVPATKKYDSLQNDVDALRNEVKELRTLVRFLTSGVTALTMHSDSLREAILRHDPAARIDTASEVLTRVRANIALTDSD